MLLVAQMAETAEEEEGGKADRDSEDTRSSEDWYSELRLAILVSIWMIESRVLRFNARCTKGIDTLETAQFQKSISQSERDVSPYD